uniref:Aa_trans domain-containing protein n=1 Tax=Macrostomum lignano TaxID=282301 RepID=A0A1I8FCC9_9PLAT
SAGRPVVLISCAAELSLSLAECLAPNLPVYLTLHFCRGIFATVGLLAAVCVAEFVACRHRAAVANLLWRVLVLRLRVCGLAGLLCAALALAAGVAALADGQRRNSEALRVCQRIAKINQRSIPTATVELMTAQRPVFQSESHIKELFNTPVMLRKTLVLFSGLVSRFAISLTYYGVSLDSGFVVASNAFHGAVSLIEAPPTWLPGCWPTRLGRRVPSMAMYIGLGACLALLNLPDRDSVIYTLICPDRQAVGHQRISGADSLYSGNLARPLCATPACSLAAPSAGRLGCRPFVVMNGGGRRLQAGRQRRFRLPERRRRPCDRRVSQWSQPRARTRGSGEFASAKPRSCLEPGYDDDPPYLFFLSSIVSDQSVRVIGSSRT